nr:tyrosine-type recombinase/integrase [Paracoccus saliphilus]
MASPWKHPESGFFYLRERVPVAIAEQAKGRRVVVPVDGQPIAVAVNGLVKLSLRTKDVTTAKERYREAAAALQEHWRLIKQETTTGPVQLTQRQTEAFAGEYLRDQTRQHQDDPGDPDEWDAGLSALEDMGQTGEGLERLHGEDADRMLQRRGLAVDAPSRKRLLEAMHRAYVIFAEGQERRGLGDFRPDPRAERFPEFPSAPGEKGSRRSELTEKMSADSAGVTLSDLFDLWAKEHQKGEGPDKTVRDFRQKVDSLRAYLGHENAAQVFQRQIIDWCDHLQDEEKLAAKTVGDKYLTAVRAMFRVGVEKARLTFDPTTGVKVRKPKRVKERRSGFTDDEAKAILKAALRDPSTLGGMSERNKLAIRWTPWIGAYTGARITELTQLRKVDFVTKDGVACIRITPEAGRVKTGQYREVPLHPHLVEMGILEFVAGRPEEHLFVSAGETLEETHRRCQSVSGKVSEWVRKVAGVTDERVQPTHGWRHRFKALAAKHDIPPEYADQIQGHSRGDAAAAYREPDAPTLFREIEKLPKIDLASDSGD